jgi:hypothetical protein
MVPDWRGKVNPMLKSTTVYPTVRDYEYGYRIAKAKAERKES